MIKLTGSSQLREKHGRVQWINPAFIMGLTRDGDDTCLLLVGKLEITVQETPEHILQLIEQEKTT